MSTRNAISVRIGMSWMTLSPPARALRDQFGRACGEIRDSLSSPFIPSTCWMMVLARFLEDAIESRASRVLLGSRSAFSRMGVSGSHLVGSPRNVLPGLAFWRAGARQVSK